VKKVSLLLRNRNNLFGGTLEMKAYFIDMGLPEEIPNIEHFPLSPRMAHPHVPSSPQEETELTLEITKRTLTPAHKIQVEFWHQGEKAAEVVSPVKSSPSNPSNLSHPSKRKQRPDQRADQLGWIMGVLALIVIAVTIYGLYLNNKKYSYKDGFSKKSSTPTIDFYQGNNAFTKKVQQERGVENEFSGVEVRSLPGGNTDMEIPVKDQMASMNEKLEKIRAQKLIEEPPIPMLEKLQKPAMPLGVKPSDLKKFDNPLEFNGMLPESLQQTD
jgi:hypothetical protein